MTVIYLDDTGQRLDNGNAIVFEGHIKLKPNWNPKQFKYVALTTKEYLKLIKRKATKK